MLWNIYGAGLPQRALERFSWPPWSHCSRRGRSPYRTSLVVSVCLRPSAFVSPWLGSSEHLHTGGDEDARLSSCLCSVNEADGAAEIWADGWFLSSVWLPAVRWFLCLSVLGLLCCCRAHCVFFSFCLWSLIVAPSSCCISYLLGISCLWLLFNVEAI